MRRLVQAVVLACVYWSPSWASTLTADRAAARSFGRFLGTDVAKELESVGYYDAGNLCEDLFDVDYGGFVCEDGYVVKAIFTDESVKANLSAVATLTPLRRLRTLHLGKTPYIRGSLPANLSLVFPNLTEIIIDKRPPIGDYEDAVSFKSSFPFPTVLSQPSAWLSRFIRISLTGLSLTGQLPSYDTLTSLETVEFGGNLFSPSAFPQWVATLSKSSSLRTFACGSCGLTGAIDQPDWTGSLLSNLNISGNDVSGSLSPFAAATKGQLQTLSVAYNKKLSFSFGSDFLPKNFSNLVYLDVSGVDFRINFDRPDADFSLIKGLSVFRAAGSGSTGNIAQNLRLPDLIRIINLSNNAFGSKFPLSLVSLPLTSLELANCSLSGPLPQYLPQSLTIFDASNNALSGSLADEVIQSKRLAVLRLNNNKLSGRLPPVGMRSCLQELDLSNNAFNGSLPDYGNGNYTESEAGGYTCYGFKSVEDGENCDGPCLLRSVNISRNYLEGPISPSYFEPPSPVYRLDLSFNRLGGRIPSFNRTDDLFEILYLRQNLIACPQNDTDMKYEEYSEQSDYYAYTQLRIECCPARTTLGAIWPNIASKDTPERVAVPCSGNRTYGLASAICVNGRWDISPESTTFKPCSTCACVSGECDEGPSGTGLCRKCNPGYLMPYCSLPSSGVVPLRVVSVVPAPGEQGVKTLPDSSWQAILTFDSGIVLNNGTASRICVKVLDEDRSAVSTGCAQNVSVGANNTLAIDFPATAVLAPGELFKIEIPSDTVSSAEGRVFDGYGVSSVNQWTFISSKAISPEYSARKSSSVTVVLKAVSKLPVGANDSVERAVWISKFVDYLRRLLKVQKSTFPEEGVSIKSQDSGELSISFRIAAGFESGVDTRSPAGLALIFSNLVKEPANLPDAPWVTANSSVKIAVDSNLGGDLDSLQSSIPVIAAGCAVFALAFIPFVMLRFLSPYSLNDCFPGAILSIASCVVDAIFVASLANLRPFGFADVFYSALAIVGAGALVNLILGFVLFHAETRTRKPVWAWYHVNQTSSAFLLLTCIANCENGILLASRILNLPPLCAPLSDKSILKFRVAGAARLLLVSIPMLTINIVVRVRLDTWTVLNLLSVIFGSLYLVFAAIKKSSSLVLYISHQLQAGEPPSDGHVAKFVEADASGSTELKLERLRVE